MAWAAIIISVPKVSYDLQLRCGSIAVPRFAFITACKGTGRHRIEYIWNNNFVKVAACP